MIIGKATITGDLDLYMKAYNVVISCTTIPQMKIAGRYLQRAIKELHKKNQTISVSVLCNVYKQRAKLIKNGSTHTQ